MGYRRFLVFLLLVGLLGSVGVATQAHAAANSFNTVVANLNFSQLVADVSGSNTVYAAGSDSNNNPYVYKSTNQGASWAPVNSGLTAPFAVYTLAIAPSSTQTLYLGGYNPVSNSAVLYISTNGGTSWSAIGSGLGSVSVQALAVSQANANTVYAGTNHGLYESTNGSSFSLLTNLGNVNVQALAIDPTNAAVIYAGTNPATSGGVWKSTDGGQTWTQENTGLPSGTGVFHLAVTPGSATTFYAAVGTSPSSTALYQTTNAGTSWTNLNLNSSVVGIAVSPLNGSLLFVSGSNGLFLSANSGASFTVAGNYANAPVAMDNNQPQTLYVGGQGISSYTGTLATIVSTAPTPTPTPGATGTASITGTLLYAPSQASAANASVSLICSNCAGTPTVATTTANASGGYTFNGVTISSGQLYTVMATATVPGGPVVATGPNYSGESALVLTSGQTATVNFHLVPLDSRYFPQTGFRIGNDTIWDYFNRRGGVTAFGYPTSRAFTFEG
ncbi:MAG: hypothetical protein M1298_00225, partial [Chloroflexi bacterium]|nr:hypothetical protein [Chloroflexota bacterium]